MEDRLHEDESLLFIFIGEQVSPGEIQIHQLPTFYDALHLSRNQTSIKENPTYQYLNLDFQNQIHFNYLDGTEKKSGKLLLNHKSLEITMENPLNAFLGCLLVQKGNKLSFLALPPNNKIKLRKKDATMYHFNTKKLQ